MPVVEAVTQLTSDGEVKANSGEIGDRWLAHLLRRRRTLGRFTESCRLRPPVVPPPSSPHSTSQYSSSPALSQDGSYLLGAQRGATRSRFLSGRKEMDTRWPLRLFTKTDMNRA